MKKINSLNVFALSLGIAFMSIGSAQADEAWQKKAGDLKLLFKKPGSKKSSVIIFQTLFNTIKGEEKAY